MKTLDYFNDIINDVTPNYIKKWKYNENNFTRNRKHPPYTLCLQIFANKGRSIKNELFINYGNLTLSNINSDSDMLKHEDVSCVTKIENCKLTAENDFC